MVDRLRLVRAGHGRSLCGLRAPVGANVVLGSTGHHPSAGKHSCYRRRFGRTAARRKYARRCHFEPFFRAACGVHTIVAIGVCVAAYSGVARCGLFQPRWHRSESRAARQPLVGYGTSGYGAVSPVLHRARCVGCRRFLDDFLRHRLFCAGNGRLLSGAGQFCTSQSLADAAAYRAHVVFQAVLCHVAQHDC